MKAMIIGLSTLMLGLGVAFAQDQAGDRFLTQAGESDLRASELMAATVYVTEADVSTTTVEDVPEDWESVASVDDFLLSQDGTLRGILVDVGGFLGIGARQVMVSSDALTFVRQEASDGLHVVFTSTREELEEAPEYQDDSMAGETNDEEAPRADEEEASAEEDEEASSDEAQAEDAPPVGVPEEPMEGFEPVDVGTLTVDELRSAAVYDRLNEQVSGIEDVQLAAEGGQVVAVLIDVGGFLGIGARTVAVDIEEIEIQVDPERDDVRVYLNMTRDELEGLPEVER